MPWLRLAAVAAALATLLLMTTATTRTEAAITKLEADALFSGVVFDPADARVADRLAIADTITRYCVSLDRKDWTRLKTVFTSDAVVDYTANNAGYKGGVDGAVAYLESALGIFATSVHSATNVEIAFRGPNDAVVRAYLDNPMWIRFFPFVPLFTIRGVYLHEMVRTKDGHWKSRGVSEEIWAPFDPQLVAFLSVLGVVVSAVVRFVARRVGVASSSSKKGANAKRD